MKNFWLVLIALTSFSVSAQTCSISEGAEKQYSRFFNLWAEKTKEDGSEYKTRTMTNGEKSEAWSCLIMSAESGSLSAVQILELFYRFGAEGFDIEANPELADHYKNLKIERSQKIKRSLEGTK